MLDTNICIYLIKNHPPEVAKRFAQYYYGDIGISTITLAELNAGIEKSINKEQAKVALTNLLEDLIVAPFDEQAADQYGLKRKEDPDRKKNAMDRLIASHASAIGCVLVTNNPDDFKRYSGLTIENWVENK